MSMLDQLFVIFFGLLSLFLGFRFFTIAMVDLGETLKGRVSGVLAVGFFIIMLVTKYQIG